MKSVCAKGGGKVNVADVVSKAGPLVDTSRLQGARRLWNLEDSSRERVRSLLGLPKADVEVEHDVGTLEDLVAKVSDLDVRNYLEEALKCLQVGAFRACVVFLWTAGIRTIQADMMTKGPKAVPAALQTHDRNGRIVRGIDDFAYFTIKQIV